MSKTNTITRLGCISCIRQVLGVVLHRNYGDLWWRLLNHNSVESSNNSGSKIPKQQFNHFFKSFFHPLPFCHHCCDLGVAWSCLEYELEKWDWTSGPVYDDWPYLFYSICWWQSTYLLSNNNYNTCFYNMNMIDKYAGGTAPDSEERVHTVCRSQSMVRGWVSFLKYNIGPTSWKWIWYILFKLKPLWYANAHIWKIWPITQGGHLSLHGISPNLRWEVAWISYDYIPPPSILKECIILRSCSPYIAVHKVHS